MKLDGEELRCLVDHLAQALQGEDNRESGDKFADLPTSEHSAARRVGRPWQDSPSHGSASWQWQDWRIRPIDGGLNNRLFRATGPAVDAAVKFAIRDKRDRAGREWAALNLLAERSSTLAPQPLLLERERYPQQVIVQTWLDGESSDAAPADDAAWNALCQHLLAVHSLPFLPDHPAVRPSVLYVTSAAEALQAIHFQYSLLPPEEWPQPVQDLVVQALSIPWPDWPTPPLSFCRGDANIRNFIRRNSSWASVDWEYSGWGDPAFEIAEFLVHAAHSSWPRRQTRRLLDIYNVGSSESAISERIAVYEPLMLVWWTLRLGRLLPEARAGRDKRLVAVSQTWLEERETLLTCYLQLAEAALANRDTFL